jgi:hypothetical protein
LKAIQQIRYNNLDFHKLQMHQLLAILTAQAPTNVEKG